MSKKKSKPKWRKTGTGWTATVEQSAHDMVVARYRVRREQDKAAGTLGVRPGSGFHDSNVDRKNRRERRNWKNQIRKGKLED